MLLSIINNFFLTKHDFHYMILEITKYMIYKYDNNSMYIISLKQITFHSPVDLNNYELMNVNKFLL